MENPRKRNHLIIVGALLFVLVVSAPVLALASEDPNLDPNTQFYVAKRNQGAIEQIAGLTSNGDYADADLISAMIETPQSVWFTGGTPHKTQQDVKNTVQRAAGKKTVPVLVAYNIPFRDCAQFSAGGATTVEEYTAWIDGFAAGIGDSNAVVILEPDGLGIIPYYTNIDGGLEWCQPVEADPETAADERFIMMNYAVDALKAKPNVSVYLDATHNGWLNVGDASHRLAQAGVDRADGFYLNVSNYQFTANSVKYGTWVSSCLDMGSFAECPNQYWNGGPPTGWNGTAMDNYQEWRNEPYSGDPADLAWNTVGIDERYADSNPTTHFVIDTSRNGVGPWDPSAEGYPDPQDWCNPPDRGLGLLPTADTGITLVDAYLWVKIPGESDGECTRGLGPAGETVDPEWGVIDPPAGEWFPEMALDLAQNANPPLP
ncbi:glycoside hydrolase family 6 protein [Chloroflexota bacterium]